MEPSAWSWPQPVVADRLAAVSRGAPFTVDAYRRGRRLQRVRGTNTRGCLASALVFDSSTHLPGVRVRRQALASSGCSVLCSSDPLTGRLVEHDDRCQNALLGLDWPTG